MLHGGFPARCENSLELRGEAGVPLTLPERIRVSVSIDAKKRLQPLPSPILWFHRARKVLSEMVLEASEVHRSLPGSSLRRVVQVLGHEAGKPWRVLEGVQLPVPATSRRAPQLDLHLFQDFSHSISCS